MDKKEKLIGKTKEIAASLKKSEKIDNMLIMGGLAEGFADKYSDVDTVCYCNRRLSLKELKKLLEKHDYKFLWIDDRRVLRVDIIYRGVKITLLFLETRWLKRDLKEYKKINPRDYDKQRFIYNFLGNTIVIFDKLKIVKKNQKKIRKEVMKAFKSFALFELAHKLNYNFFLKGGAINIERKRGNILLISEIFSSSLKKMWKILYALNDNFYTNSKWVYRYIPRFKNKPKNCMKKLKVMSTMDTKEETLDRKIELFREFILDLKKIMEKEGVRDLPSFETSS
jgi:predicted nucleotidyltransferase